MQPRSLLAFLLTAVDCFAQQKSLNFLMLGDWGQSIQSDRTNQTAVAYQMGVYGWRIDAQFVMALGDNFYEYGIANVTDPQWDLSFHDVYSAASLDIPWYPILGNHDYRVDPQAQIDRSFEEGETMWTLPSRYYVYNYTLSDGTIISVVNVDTQLIDPDHDDTGIVYENKNWRRVRSNHLDWIDETLLEQSKYASWLIVTGHYPIYSVGVNGDNSVLLKYLAPILQKHKVHMYVAGHDHNNQYIEMKDGICYVVCGQGAGRGPFGEEGVKYYGISESTNYIKLYNSFSGFAYVQADGSTFNTTFVDVDGNKRYTGVLDKPYTSDYRASVVAGRSSSSGGGTGSARVYRPSAEEEDSWVGAAIVVPGMLVVAGLLMFVFRETPAVQFVVTMAKQGGTEIKTLATNLRRDLFENGGPKIRPDLDDSTRSDVGFTADMDRSGRRQNIVPRQQKQTVEVKEMKLPEPEQNDLERNSPKQGSAVKAPSAVTKASSGQGKNSKPESPVSSSTPSEKSDLDEVKV